MRDFISAAWVGAWVCVALAVFGTMAYLLPAAGMMAGSLVLALSNDEDDD